MDVKKTYEKNKDRPGMNLANAVELEIARKKHIGESKIICDGRTMTIVDWYNKSNITVEFSDGTSKTMDYGAFRRRRSYDPDKKPPDNGYVGETAVDKYGNVMEILEYNNASDITVSVAGMVLKHKHLDTFHNPNAAYKEVAASIRAKRKAVMEREKQRKAAAKQKRAEVKDKSYIGTEIQAHNGMMMKCLDKRGGRVDIEFEDGTVVKDAAFSAFRRGAVANPSCPDATSFNNKVIDRAGETGVAKNGLRMKILSTTDRRHNLIQFEDGETVEKSYKTFLSREVKNPSLKMFGFPYDYHGTKVLGKAFATSDTTYFYVETSAGGSDLMTPQQMLNKAGIEPAF